jgi:Zn-dependent protease
MIAMRSLTLAKVQGIDVRVHPTFALVALWVVYYWGIAGGGGIQAVAYGALLIGFVFFFVLLHEFGHSFMAQQYGLKVRDITLVPFGGVARIEHLPTRPSAEAVIALSGPLVNLAVVFCAFPLILLLGITQGFNSCSDYFRYDLGQVSLGGFLVQLWLVNLLIAAFNLLPAFPMDGGRILRAALTRVLGRQRATLTAVACGIALAVVMGIIGIALRDYFLPFISIFIVVAAVAEGRAVRLEESMRRLHVGQFSVWERGGVAPRDPLALALRDGLRDVVVTDKGRVVGMLWKQVLLQAMQTGSLQRRAYELMDRGIETAESDVSVYDVHVMMNSRGQWAVPITEDGIYRGVFTAERFIHVHRYLDTHTSERRHFDAFAGSIGQLWRSWVRSVR